MTLLSVVKDVCAVVGVTVPTSVFTNITANRTMQEMLATANEQAQRIAYDTRDWMILRKSNVMTGDGVKTTFGLPADYKRMLLTSNVWRSTSAIQPMTFIPDTDEWMSRRAQNIYSSFGEWTMLNGGVVIAPTMSASVTAYYAYIHRNAVTLASGGRGDSFLSDNDSFLLDERLLKLGMIWQWKAQKGSPYNEDLGTFQDALAVAMGHDNPAPIMIGKKPMSAAVRVAYPFPLPTGVIP
jgi:hypothetical protein